MKNNHLNKCDLVVTSIFVLKVLLMALSISLTEVQAYIKALEKVNSARKNLQSASQIFNKINLPESSSNAQTSILLIEGLISKLNEEANKYEPFIAKFKESLGTCYAIYAFVKKEAGRGSANHFHQVAFFTDLETTKKHFVSTSKNSRYINETFTWSYQIVVVIDISNIELSMINVVPSLYPY